jgi:hypothetical protein
LQYNSPLKTARPGPNIVSAHSAALPPCGSPMNAPLLIDAKLAAQDAAPRLREIP